MLAERTGKTTGKLQSEFVLDGSVVLLLSRCDVESDHNFVVFFVSCWLLSFFS